MRLSSRSTEHTSSPLVDSLPFCFPIAHIAPAGHFANIYHRVIDAYLLVDREAETSIKYFALQLFTVPSAALHIVQFYNIVSRILNIITAFFTNQISDRRINYPAASAADVDVDSEP